MYAFWLNTELVPVFQSTGTPVPFGILAESGRNVPPRRWWEDARVLYRAHEAWPRCRLEEYAGGGCQVAGLRISTKNAGDLREQPVVSCGVSHHAARDEANAAAIDPIRYPNCCDPCLLFPSTINCILRRCTTTSSFNTLPKISRSLHERPWQLISVPTISRIILLGWTQQAQ